MFIYLYTHINIYMYSVCVYAHVLAARNNCEIDGSMDMHTCILHVHTHVTWSVKGARDAEACQALCVCMCSLCVHVCACLCA